MKTPGSERTNEEFRLKKLREKLVTHGRSKTLEYRLWHGVIARCINPSATDYHLYGGRGIKVCDRWRNSFEAFMEDMGERPSREYSIERIDGNGDYEPGNCRWATTLEQAHNRSNTRRLMWRGKLTVLAEIARALNVVHSNLTYWTDKAGISVDEFEVLRNAMVSAGIKRMDGYAITIVITTPDTNMTKLFDGHFWVVVSSEQLSPTTASMKVIHKKIRK